MIRDMVCIVSRIYSSFEEEMGDWKDAYLVTILVLVAANAVAAQNATTPPPVPLDVTWFISPSGTSDTNCGRTSDSPCDSLQTILNQSPLFNVTSSLGAPCFGSSGNNDGRRSTTVYFDGGENFVPPACLKNWTNLAIIGLGDVTITSTLGAPRAFFEFAGCSNVTIRNLRFVAAFPGKGTLYFEMSRQITVTNCTVPLIQGPSMGIEIVMGGGDVQIASNLFYGNANPVAEGGSTVGLKITQGRQTSGCSFQRECNKGVLEAINLLITNCTFQDIVSGGTPSDSYGTTHTDAIALSVRFFSGASNNRMVVRNSLFTGINYTRASSVLVDYDSTSVNNYAQFINCTFRENHVRYGGGIAAYFYTSPQNGFLDIEDCDFTNNEASLEGGGVFVVFLSRNLENSIRISRSRFTGNYAQYGAGIFLFNNPAWFNRNGPPDAVSLPLVRANITDCVFEENRALLTEGVINALRILLNISGVNTFTRSTGSAIVLRSSLAYIGGEVVFDSNFAFTGGALNILDGSRADMSDVTSANFTRNKGTFAGGAIFADEASTTISSNEYTHALAQGRFGRCFLMFGNEFNLQSVRGRFIFDGNTAITEGQTNYIFNLRGCIISNFVPNDTAQFLTLPSDGTVLYKNANPLDSTSTGANYLYFYGTSTKCYKPVGDVIYLLPNCSHELLLDMFYAHPDLQCALRNFDHELGRFYSPGTGLRPTLDKLITPWAGIETSWMQEPGSLRLLCNESIPGNLYLSPAPGEQFDLTIQLADQLLSYVASTIYLEVEHEVDEPPGVLIQLNGIQYAYNDRVYFTPNRALSGLALVGLPRTEGRLHIVADSQIRGTKVKLLVPFKLAQCPLGYYNPPNVSSIEEVNHLITTAFRTTQRIPVNQPLACQCFSNATRFLTRVVDIPHRCIAGYTVSLNSILWAGRIPVLDSESNRAAPPVTIPCPVPPVNSTPIPNTFTEWVMRNREINALSSRTSSSINSNPVDVVPFEGVVPGGGAPVKCYQGYNVSQLVDYVPPGEFSIEFCTRGYCRGNPLTTWYLADVNYPCAENREGPLCGQCKPGYAVTLYSTTCRDCSHALTFLPILLTILFGLTLVVIVLFLNLGASPTFDSLLFFVQAIMILLSSRTNYEAFQYLSVFNPDFTFNLCITPSLDGLTRLALQYVTPVYILLLLSLALLITRIIARSKRLSKYASKHSFLQALWLLFLITYINIANTTFELLHCRVVGPENGVQEFVLAHDASIVCYQGVHLPFAIIGIVLASFLVLPFPWYVLALICFPKLKPITDVYCSPYKDNRRWWVWWSLKRRIFLVLLGIFVQDFVYRHFTLLLAFALILAVFELTWPYQTQFDNYFGCFVSWMTLIVAIVTLPSIYIYVDPHRIVSAILVLATIVLGFSLLVVEIVLRFKGKSLGIVLRDCMRPRFVEMKEYVVRKIKSVRSSDELELEESTLSSIIPSVSTIDATAYREPLLDSSYYAWEGGSSSKSVSVKRGNKRKGKSTMSHQHLMTQSPNARTRPTVSVIAPDRTSGYSDSGFATAHTE